MIYVGDINGCHIFAIFQRVSLWILMFQSVIAPHMYSTLSSPCRSKQTMIGWMDDRMNGQMK